MRKFNQLLGNHKAPFYTVLFICAGVFIAGFFVPPLGVIDGSVLKGIAEIGALYPVYLAGEAIEKGYDAKIHHNETEVILSTKDGEEEK